MARRTPDWFTEPLGLVYIAGNTAEATTAERLLTEREIDYVVELESFVNDSVLGTLFGGTYTGLFVYVPVADHSTVKELLEINGLRDTVDLHEAEKHEREHGT